MGFNGSGAVSGGLSGAATGFSVGGPIGAGIGAVAGGLMGGFSGGGSPKKISTLDKNQRRLNKKYIAGLEGEGEFANLFNFDSDAAMKNFQTSYANPAMQSWKDNVVPGITGSFRGGNLQNSSYLGGALARSGEAVQTDLNARMADMLYRGNESAMERRLNSLQDILNRQTFAYEQPQEGAGSAVLSGLSSGIGQGMANRFNGGGSTASASSPVATPSQKLPGFNPSASAPVTSGKWNLPTFGNR